MSDKSPLVSTNTRPSQPSFDHQALAEMLTELRADPVDPQMSRPGFDTDSSSAPFSGKIDYGSTVTSPTNAESERSPRARSLLARLHHIFSTKDEPLLAENEKESLHPSLSGQATHQRRWQIHLHARREIDFEIAAGRTIVPRR